MKRAAAFALVTSSLLAFAGQAPAGDDQPQQNQNNQGASLRWPSSDSGQSAGFATGSL